MDLDNGGKDGAVDENRLSRRTVCVPVATVEDGACLLACLGACDFGCV